MTPTIDEPSLPISMAYDAFHEALRLGPVVLSSPTGSGKSTQVPRWCSESARVLVVEPRRVACRALASRIASLENTPLGQAVGYIVRDERCISPNTRIVFATPGIVLRLLASPDGIDDYDYIIIDEFHERGMETDLIFALLAQRRPKRFVVMSATIDGDRLAQHVGGTHVTAAGRTFPVDIQYRGYPSDLPTAHQLELRIQEALEEVLPDGDILIFTPGKAEIRRITSALSNLPFDILPLHGGLTLQEQSRIFSRGKRRRIIVSTNVAETSLTVPSVRTVIDTGLVRRTRYQDGRGFLTLMPIAQDSADQRAGRAGRVSSGLCIRLWGHGGRLKQSTPPELHRESIVPLVLAAMACGADPQTLPFPDSPPPHALDTARDELTAMGAIQSHALTERGRHLFRLPLRPELGRIIVEAQGSDLLEAAVDLVAALDVDRPLFIGTPEYPEDDLRAVGCDATALIAAIRIGEPKMHALASYALREMRQRARRLRNTFGLPTAIPDTIPPKLSARLGHLVLSADLRTAYIKRVRKRHVAWSNGGTEIALADTSAVTDNTDAVVVLALRSIGLDHRKGQLVATYAVPMTYASLAQAGLGETRMAAPTLQDRRPVASIERHFAGVVLHSEERQLEGQQLRNAVAQLITANRLFKSVYESLKLALRERDLVRRLIFRSLLPAHAMESLADDIYLNDSVKWLEVRLETLGLSEPDELALIDGADLLPPPLTDTARDALSRQWPLEVDLGESAYDVSYDFNKRLVTLNRTRGDRKDLPSMNYLPAFRGFGVVVTFRGKRRVLRAR